MNSRQSTYFSTYSTQRGFTNYAYDEPQTPASPDDEYYFPTAMPLIAEPQPMDFPRPGPGAPQQSSYSPTPSPSFTSTTFTTTGPNTPSPEQSFYGQSRTVRERKDDDGSSSSTSSSGFGLDDVGDKMRGFGEELHRDWDDLKHWFGRKVGRRSHRKDQSAHTRSQSQSHKQPSPKAGQGYLPRKSEETSPNSKAYPPAYNQRDPSRQSHLEPYPQQMQSPPRVERPYPPQMSNPGLPPYSVAVPPGPYYNGTAPRTQPWR